MDRDYWDSISHPHRKYLQASIAELEPARILEVGANCGPNLYLLGRQYPDAEVMGIEINQEAVTIGRRLLKDAGVFNARLDVGQAEHLFAFKDNQFDVVFTDATLIYIHPENIIEVLKQMARIARKGFVMVERQSTKEHYYGRIWLRDYPKLIKQVSPESIINITKITADMWPDKGWQENGAIIQVKKEK